MIQLTLAVPALLTLSYLAATLNAPLVDSALLRADHAIGFDWDALDTWVASHHWADVILYDSYLSYFWQPAVALFTVSLYQPGKTNGEFVWAFLISAPICFLIAAALPAFGYVGSVYSDHIEALKQLRAGLWTTLDFGHFEGIVTFPSFHAVLAIILMYAVRRVRWALAILAPLNAVMLAATPTDGGHYFVDVVAGVAVAAASIVLTKAIQRWTAKLSRRSAVRVLRALAARTHFPDIVIGRLELHW